MADFYTYRNKYTRRRRKRRAVVALLVLLTVVCIAAGLYWNFSARQRAQDPAPTPSPTAAPTQTPETAATPTPTPTPAAGEEPQRIVQAVDTAVELNRRGDYGVPVPDYVDENVSTKVVRLIQSYTGVVNRMVWRKF